MLSAVTSTCIPTLRSSLLFISFSPSLRVYKLLRRSAYFALEVAAPSADKRSDTFRLLSTMISAITESGTELWNWPIKMELLNTECHGTDRNLTEIPFSRERGTVLSRENIARGFLIHRTHRASLRKLSYWTPNNSPNHSGCQKQRESLYNSLLTPKYRPEQFPNGYYTSVMCCIQNSVNKLLVGNVWMRRKTTCGKKCM